MAKSAGQWIGTIGGAAVGFLIPGSYVALGAAIGGAIGGAIDPPSGPDIIGPRVDDLKVQTSTYGAIKPRLYGTTMVSGNVFWLEGNQIREVTTTEEQGGKGGGGSEVTTYSYYATFAVGLCKGPITGIRRLWIGDDLVSSAVNQADSGATDLQVAENALSQIQDQSSTGVKFTLYRGSDDQLPNARMQADKGVANVSAYPGECYLVIEDLNLEKWSNTLVRAQVKAEIVVDGAYSHTNTVIDDISVLAIGGTEYGTILNLRNFAFDATGANYCIQTHYALNGNPLELWWGRMEFPYSDVKSTYSISAPSGGWGYTFRFVDVTQNDTQTAISFHTAGSIDPRKKWRFWGTAGLISEWPDYTSGQNAFFTKACIDRGQVFLGADGSVIVELGYSSYPLVTASTYDIISIGASENFVWALKNTTAATTQTLYKFNRSDLTLAATYDQDTGGGSPLSMKVIDDVTVYISSVNITGSKITRWDNGVITKTFPYMTNPNYSLLGLTGFHVLSEDEFVAYGIYQHNTSGARNGLKDITLMSPVLDDSVAKLRDIVTAECALGGIGSSDLVLSTLTDSDVRGFKISTLAAIRSGFDPLQAAFPFDAFQAGYKVKFVSRGGASIASIQEIDLGTSADGKAQTLLPVTREMDSQLPCKVSVIFPNASREYDTDEQYAERLNVCSVGERRVELAIVMTPTEAAQIADILLSKDWLERTTLGPFALPPTWAHLEPADVVTISHRGASYEARIIRIEYRADGILECSAVLSAAATYTSTALGAEPLVKPPMLIGLAGLTDAYLLDIARIHEEQDVAGAAYGLMGAASGWPGAALVRSDDSGASYQVVGSTNSLAQVFISTSALSAAGSYSIDNKSALTITPLTPGASVLSVTEDQFFAGSTLAAYGADGRWEIVAFKTVSVSSGVYTLTDFLRGLYGTEQHTGNHVTGDLLIMLVTAINFMPLPVSAIGSPRLYRAVTQGRSIDSATGIEFTSNAKSLLPLSPVDINGSRHPQTLDWTISGVRRTRTPVEVFSGAVVPLGETSEQYEIEIWDSSYSTLKRTKTGLSSLSAAYPSSEQIVDFGVNQETLYVKAYQLSSVVGRGDPLVASVYRYLSLDPFADQVRLFMPCSSNFNDSIGHTVTPINGPTNSGGYGVFDGVNDWMHINGASDLFPRTGDFTHELRVTPLSMSRLIFLRDDRPYQTNGVYITLYINTAGGINFYSWSVDQIISATGIFTINNEYHVALCKSGTTTRLFVDGSQVGSFSDSLDYLDPGNSYSPVILNFGYDPYGLTYCPNVKIRDIRYTSAARYTANFTPPASPLPSPL